MRERRVKRQMMSWCHHESGLTLQTMDQPHMRRAALREEENELHKQQMPLSQILVVETILLIANGTIAGNV